ncbi:hypothetical protein [Rubinisphaera margarita]|uniref:hypothetical protein n=1 Tax=Rubinisphaera margarita TaxID=2909586 RepID=UPI001EE893C9|nr:hypothetical protein [Rubinisphaera margarita]MCG6157067.1 hypothetical protein [Rubinisphaera margarita]
MRSVSSGIGTACPLLDFFDFRGKADQLLIRDPDASTASVGGHWLCQCDGGLSHEVTGRASHTRSEVLILKTTLRNFPEIE